MHWVLQQRVRVGQQTATVPIERERQRGGSKQASLALVWPWPRKTRATAKLKPAKMKFLTSRRDRRPNLVIVNDVVELIVDNQVDNERREYGGGGRKVKR